MLTTTGELAKTEKVKCIIYGEPGCGKTPLLLTAPNPIYIAVERGQVSLKGTNAPAIQAYTLPEFYAALKWLETPEAAPFETIYIDSISAFAKLVLNDELSRKSKSGEKVNGQAAYGEMATRVLKLMHLLYALPGRNVVLLAQQDAGKERAWPYFPGNATNTELPHLFDAVLHLGWHEIPEHGKHYTLQCRATDAIFARCRFNNCADYESPNLTQLFNKLTGE